MTPRSSAGTPTSWGPSIVGRATTRSAATVSPRTPALASLGGARANPLVEKQGRAAGRRPVGALVEPGAQRGTQVGAFLGISARGVRRSEAAADVEVIDHGERV
jgi:hypothetical protein